MTAPKKTSPRASRTRAQLANELVDVREEIETAERQDPIAAQAATQRKAEVLAATAGISVNSVVSQLSNIGLSTQSVLDNLKNTMMSVVQTLTNLNDMKGLLEDELTELHGKEVLSSSLKALATDYAEKEKELSDKYKNLQISYMLGVEEKKKLEAEREETWRREHAREQEDYYYKEAQIRAKSADEFEQTRMLKLRTLNKEEEERLKGWLEREEAVTKREAELQDLREMKVSFPVELEVAKKAASEAIAKSLHGEYGHKIAMIDASNKAEKSLAEQTIKSLMAKVTDQDKVIAALQEKLEKAEARVENIARNALDSASGRHALEVAQTTMAVARDGGAPAGRKS